MLKKHLVPALVLIALLAAAGAYVVYFPARQRVAALETALVERLEQALQKDVLLEVGGARPGLRRGLGFRLYDVSLSERGGSKKRICDARYLFVGVDVSALLRGEVRIRRIFVFQPRVFLSRDPAGRLNVAGLFSAAYARQHTRDPLHAETLHETFGPILWREEISFKNGEVVFDRSSGTTEPLRFRKLDLQVTNRLGEDRLEVRAKGEVASPDLVVSMSLQAELAGWKTASSLGDLTSAVRVSLEGGDLQGLAACFHGLREGDDLRGTFSGEFSYEGSPLLPGKGSLDLVLEQPHVFVRRVHPVPFTPVRVVFHAPFEARRDGVSFAGSRVDLGGLPIRWDGDFRFDGPRLGRLDVNLSAEDLPLMEAKEYLPLGLLEGETWRFLTDMVRAGRVDARARLQGPPEAFSDLKSPEGEEALFLRLAFRDCTVVLPVPEPYLPFRSVNGVLELSRGNLRFKGFQAAYGRTRLPDIEGGIRDLHHPTSYLSVESSASLHIPETFQELDHGIFPEAVRQVGRSLRQADGKGSLKIRIDYTYGRDVEERLEVKGEALLDGVRAVCQPLQLPLTDMRGRLAFSESALSSLALSLKAGGSPVRLAGSVRFGQEGRGADGQLRFASERLAAEDLAARLGLEGQVRGMLEAEGRVSWEGGAMGWASRLRGDEMEFSAGSYLIPARQFAVEADGDAGSLEIRSIRARVAGHDLAGEGRFSSFKPLNGRVDFHASSMDLAGLLVKQKEAPRGTRVPAQVLRVFQPRPEGGAAGYDVRFGLRFDRFEARGFEASDVVMEGGVAPDRLYVDYAHGNAGGGSVIAQGEAALDDPRAPFSVLFGLSRVQAESYWKWFSLEPGYLEGTASVEGSLRGTLRPSGPWWKEIHGSFSLFSDGCTIRRYELLGKILTLINFTQWTRIRLSDLYARGLACRQIQGNLRLQKGSVSTEDLVLDTTIARVAVQGAYDIAQDRMEAEIALQPMEQLDQVLDYLPLVGRVISGPDGNVVVFHYALRGPLKDLSVELVPFKSLNHRIGSPVKRLNGWLQRLDERLKRRDGGP